MIPKLVNEDDADVPIHREGDGDADDGRGEDGGRGKSATAVSRFSVGHHGSKHSVFKSLSCFALLDLHEEDE